MHFCVITMLRSVTRNLGLDKMQIKATNLNRDTLRLSRSWWACRTMNGLTVHPSTNSGRTVKPCCLSRLKLVAEIYHRTLRTLDVLNCLQTGNSAAALMKVQPRNSEKSSHSPRTLWLVKLLILPYLLLPHLIRILGRKPFWNSIQRLVLSLQPLALPGLEFHYLIMLCERAGEVYSTLG